MTRNAPSGLRRAADVSHSHRHARIVHKPFDRPATLEAERGRTHPRLQSGALAYRRLNNGEISVLVVGKRRSRKWGIPKGKAEPELSLSDNAAKEAFEEAGVRGQIGTEPLGTYRALKRVRGLKTVIEVWVYLLEVTETATKWPEKDKREVRWCSPNEAANLLQEPLLAELCRRLADQS